MPNFALELIQFQIVLPRRCLAGGSLFVIDIILFAFGKGPAVKLVLSFFCPASTWRRKEGRPSSDSLPGGGVTEQFWCK